MKSSVHNPHVITRRAGFTLIEIAVVLVIVGIIISVAATVLPSLIQSAKIKKARAILDRNDYTLQGYIGANGRFPCPDTNGDGMENRIPGTNPPADDTCAAYVGDLPYLTLGLSSGNDNWQNAIRYGVYEDLIKTTYSGLCAPTPCTLCLSDFINNPNPLFLHTTMGSNSTNQAYVIVSGGAKDRDGVNGFFDGLNGSTPDMEFESPDKIIDATYDDLQLATAFAYLQGKLCSGGGGGGGGGGGSAGENTFPGGCNNSIDDDSDGHMDCQDQDCFNVPPCGSGGSDVVITTSSIPAGLVNSDYSATIQATGGVTAYEWTLDDDGGFSDLFLHTYTGRLSGKLNQCPGTHPIQVQVQDSTLPADGGPKTDTKSFNIQVTADLVINRTSGGGINIVWNSPTQQETFATSTGHLGDVTWDLSTTAIGFTVSSDGSDSCVLKKNSSTPTGTYGFTLTATDASCPANTATLIFSVDVTPSGGGAPFTEKQEAAWTLDECIWDGTTGEVIDSGSGGLNGTASNGANTVATGKICRAGSFDGFDDFIDMGDILNNTLGSTNSTFTVAAWINPRMLTSAQTNHFTRNCFLAKASDAFNDNLEIGVNPDGTLHVYIDAVGKDNFADFGASGDISVDKWNFVAVSYDNGTVTVRINTSTYTDSSTWSGGGNLDGAAGSPFTVGTSQHINNYFNGKIDEVYIFHDVLSAEEVDQLVNITRSSCTGSCYTEAVAEYRMDEVSWSGSGSQPDVADSSGYAYHGTSYYGVNTTDSGKICRGGVFTDSGDNINNDRIRIPNQVADGLQDYTVSVWIKTTLSGQQAILSGANSSQNNELLLFFPNGSTLRTYLKGANNSYSAALDNGTWHHVAWMREGSREQVYFDGTLLGTNSVVGTAITIGSNGLWLGSEQDTVGGGWDSNQEYVGTMDEVYLYKRALSESEIETIWNTTRTCN